MSTARMRKTEARGKPRCYEPGAACGHGKPLGMLREGPSWVGSDGGTYLNCDDPRQGLAGVGTTLDGDAQGGRTFLHADEGGRGLQEPGLQV